MYTVKATHWATEQFHLWNRRRKTAFIERHMVRHEVKTVILVGVGGEARGVSDGMIERSIATLGTVVATADIAPRNTKSFVLCDGRALPFKAGAADMVFSNAVVEHVGGKEDQIRFVAEHARVGRIWVTTTPNRWFPVESHTLAMFRHWSSSWRLRQDAFTRLLSRRELRALVGPDTVVTGRLWSPTFIAHGGSVS